MTGRAGSGRRILFVTSNYPRWKNDTTTPFVHDLAAALVARDWDVTVLAPHAPGAARREGIDGVKVHRFRYMLPTSAQTICYGGGALVNLQESRWTKAKLPALVAAEWAATTRRLVAGVDLVHAHWALPQGFVAATTPLRAAPRVLTVHGSDVNTLRGSVVDRFTRYALRRADRVTVGSPATELVVRELAGAGVRLLRAPIGINTLRRPRPALVSELRQRYRRGDGPLLVYVGRVVVEKGVEDIVRAVAALSADLPGLSAVVAGTGQHLERVRQLAASLGVGDRLYLPGWVPPEEVPSWFAAGDVAVAPSRVAEGQGLAVIEAMAAERAVIATPMGGLADTVEDGVTGRMVSPGDSADLADAIARMAADPLGTAEMGRRAAASVTDRFGWEASVDRFESLYEELLGRPTKGA